ncbi:MAG: ABC transporter ATP-binding protein [Propionibacteriaceae bacterium]|nr:ABC transporter ATP-binding protein [Propionibacteriaceae bacterium]
MRPHAGLRIADLTVRYGDTVAVDDVSVAINPGQILALVGPSGCGKTSILRAVAGLISPAAGTIEIGGRDMTASSPSRRGIGLVPQSYAIFPHMSVRRNVEYGLTARGVRGLERDQKVNEVLALVELEQYAERKPSALSGGQRQRVAVARALAIDPTVLLLDEPLSALDPQLRAGLRRSLSSSLAEVGCTTVIVTHDQTEAMALAHSIAILRDGRLVQQGTPEELWNAPVDEFVADFLGSGRLLPAVPDGDRVTLLDGAWSVPREMLETSRESSGDRVLVRRDSLVLAPDPTPASIGARLLHTEFAGSSIRLRLEIRGVAFDIDHVGPAPATPDVHVMPRPEGIVLL